MAAGLTRKLSMFPPTTATLGGGGGGGIGRDRGRGRGRGTGRGRSHPLSRSSDGDDDDGGDGNGDGGSDSGSDSDDDPVVSASAAAGKIRLLARRHREGKGGSAFFSAKFLKCAILTTSWFGLSTALALFNKEVFGRRHGGFPAPLFLTSVGLCGRQFAIHPHIQTLNSSSIHLFPPV